MQQKLKISSEIDTLRFAGPLDIYGVETAKTALLAHLASHSALELDLSAVSACDLAGLQLLIAARKGASATGKKFSIGASSDAIKECCALSGIAPESIS